MPSSYKPWTARIMEILADGAEHDIDAVLAEAGQLVSEDEALDELGPDRNTTQDHATRVKAGRRQVAMQALNGRIRFGAVDRIKGTKKIKLGAGSSGSISTNIKAIEALTERLDAVVARLDKLEGVEPSPLDELADAPESIQTVDAP